MDQAFEARVSDIAREYLESFPDVPLGEIKSVISLVFKSREQHVTDRAIFYALARQFHPDLNSEDKTKIMKLINEMYDSEKRRFSLD